MGALLIGKDVSKTYQSGTSETIALRSVSLSIAKGEKVAVLGPSGCGKSTLLNVLGLLIPPTQGSLAIDGIAAHHLSARKMAAYRNRFFGYIVQDFALVPSCTVMQNVEIPLLYAAHRLGRKARRKAVLDMLEALDIAGKVAEPVGNLSGGQRQRVAIARAMVNQPEIILADEPTGALDSATGEDVMGCLVKYVQGNKALVMVTHDAAMAQKYCDRSVHMLDGRFVE